MLFRSVENLEHLVRAVLGVDDRTAALHVDVAGPVHDWIVFFRHQQIAGDAVKRVAEAVAVEVHQGFAHLSLDLDVGQDHFVDAVTGKGDHALSLLGWNGSYADPDNFVGALFGSPNAQLSMNDPQLVSKITRARSMPNGTERVAAYEAINQQLAETVPAGPS